jgi:hypothetical protein
MFQNVAYRPTVYITGAWGLQKLGLILENKMSENC